MVVAVGGNRKDWHAPIPSSCLGSRWLRAFAIKTRELRCQEAPEAPSATKPVQVCSVCTAHHARTSHIWHIAHCTMQTLLTEHCTSATKALRAHCNPTRMHFHETRAERGDLEDWTMRVIFLRLAIFHRSSKECLSS